jgi:hypothetical protein
MAIYAHVCSSCEHPVSGHRLAADADTVRRPYDCYFGRCECRIMQTDMMRSIDEADFNQQFPGWPRQLRPIPVSPGSPRLSWEA